MTTQAAARLVAAEEAVARLVAARQPTPEEQAAYAELRAAQAAYDAETQEAYDAEAQAAPAIYTATVLLDARDPDSLFFAWGSCMKEARDMLADALAEAFEGVSFEAAHAIAAQALVVQVPAQTVHTF